jgi:hypothetical protein
MKKQINFFSNWPVKSIITVTILSAMLCTLNAKADNKPLPAANTVNVEMKSESGVESLLDSNVKTEIEAMQYNAEEFVAAEMALEAECWMNGDVESDIKAAKYNAEEFVKEEMALEKENWVNQNGLRAGFKGCESVKF